MSTYVVMVIGKDNRDEIEEVLWPYCIQNKDSYSFRNVTAQVFDRLLSKYSVSYEELTSFNNSIFHALVNQAYKNDGFIYASSAKDEALKPKENFYSKEGGAYRFYEYSHKYPYIKAGISFEEESAYLGTFRSHIRKKDFDIDSLLDSKNSLLLAKMMGIVDEDGVWHSLDSLLEENVETINRLLSLLEPETKITLIHYFD